MRGKKHISPLTNIQHINANIFLYKTHFKHGEVVKRAIVLYICVISEFCQLYKLIQILIEKLNCVHVAH